MKCKFVILFVRYVMCSWELFTNEKLSIFFVSCVMSRALFDSVSCVRVLFCN